jgi:hypothetical protein
MDYTDIIRKLVLEKDKKLPREIWIPKKIDAIPPLIGRYHEYYSERKLV